MPDKLYRLNEGDREILRKSLQEPNYFTDYYMKGPMTGTWWRKIDEQSDIPEIQTQIDKWVKGYTILHNRWNALGKPPSFTNNERNYRTVYEDNYDYPAFHDNHGLNFLPWWRDLWFAKQRTRVIIGGYGSAKTWAEMVCNLMRMATLPFYRALVIAPVSFQAMEVYQQIKILLTGTEYEKRFVKGQFIMKPVPTIRVRNDQVIESTMEFYSLDHPEKLLNLTCDSFHVEQAEQIDNLDNLFEIMAGRLRGQINGRERAGIITVIANSDEAGNPQLWDLAEDATTDPENILYLNPPTFANIYITPRQLKDIAKRMGNDPERRARALFGKRPIGSGEHFSRESIEKCYSPILDEIMQKGRETDEKNHTENYRLITQPKAQVVEWAIPPIQGNIYLLAADPGWSNPPNRNSAALMVFDITHFPEQPATLAAFSWVYGNNSPDPWIMRYMDLCTKYGCINRNAFDSTGPQSGYGHMVHGLNDLNPWPVNMGGGKKFIYLNAAKTMVARGQFGFPDIPMLFSQLAKYRLPDDKLRQDLVMCLTVVAAQLDYMFNSPEENEVDEDPDDNLRYKYHSRESFHSR